MAEPRINPIYTAEYSEDSITGVLGTSGAGKVVAQFKENCWEVVKDASDTESPTMDGQLSFSYSHKRWGIYFQRE